MTVSTSSRVGVTGNMLVSDTGGAKALAEAPFGHALVAAAESNPRIVGLTADLGKYTDIHLFAQRFPERFFQVGMAEQNLIGVAAGLARTGLVPFATTYCVFATRRAYDFIALAVALGKTNVKIIAGLPGLTTGYGGTHQGIEDLALMRSIPNLVVLDPCDATELAQATAAIAEYDGPVYMRLLRGQVPIVLDPTRYQFELGKAKLLTDGNDVAIISTGLMTGRALEAAERLQREGIRAAVLHVSTIKPFDRDAVLSLVGRVGLVVTAENHTVTGGLASTVADAMADAGLSARLARIGIPDCFCESGSLPYLMQKYRMGSDDIAAAARTLLETRGLEVLHRPASQPPPEVDGELPHSAGERFAVADHDCATGECATDGHAPMAEELVQMPRAARGRVRPQMQITQIETIRVPEHCENIWVRVHVSDGLIGVGETFYIPGAVESVIHDFAAPLLLGQSAFDRERHWQNLFSHANFFGHAGAELRAVSALDIALWDLAGQYLQQPIYNLLGGRCRDTIRIYNTCVNTPQYADHDGFLHRPAELAESLLAEGITQMKVWPWDQFAPQLRSDSRSGPAGWSAVGPPGHDLSTDELKRGLWTVQEIRRVAGDRMAIAIEGHSRWDLNCALRIARALEPYDVLWAEDLIQPTNVDDLARLVRETLVPQSVSERLFTKFAFRDVLARQAAHIVMPDVIWTGGLTEAVKIAALADAYHLPIAPHDCTGPINVFACLHLCASVPNAMVMETVRGFCDGYYNEIVTEPVPLNHGRAELNFGPGLGTTLRPELLARRDLNRRISNLSNTACTDALS